MTASEKTDAILEKAQHLHQQGRLQEAEALYREVLQREPSHPEALLFLGLIRHQQGRGEEALGLMQRALAGNPGQPHYHCNLALVLTGLGQAEAAMQAYREALRLKADYPEAHLNLGILLKEQGRTEEAIGHYRQALEGNPALAPAYNALGNALRERGEAEAAVAAFRQALELNPRAAVTHYNLAGGLKDLGKIEDAMQHYREALRLKPGYGEAHYNLAETLKLAGRHEASIEHYRKAIEIVPESAESHFGLGGALLITGNIQEGWPLYEWRLRLPTGSMRYARVPRWNGEPLNGKTILVWTEQGVGDSIQFIRYLALLKQHGAHVILDCVHKLQGLLEHVAGVDRIAGQQVTVQVDYQVPLLSLPGILGTTLATIPADVPYMRPDGDSVRAWRERLAPDRNMKIGLTWSGNPAFIKNHYRSFALATYAPLATLPRVSLYSLQKGPAATQAKSPPSGLRLADYTDELEDFADTAALIMNLDLVISVDTSVAHLAGALGRPVWTLLHADPDWRWLLNREDSPWYPTMRLFRQPVLGDWDPVIRRVAAELEAVVKQRFRDQ
jgi:tetratricopeptide (TPR) repeat protein